jgi:hypothetical protein
MESKVKILPGSPQWQAWREFRLHDGRSVLLMDQCEAAGKPWLEASEWPTNAARDAFDPTVNHEDQSTTLSKGAQCLGFVGTVERHPYLLHVDGAVATAGLRPTDKVTVIHLVESRRYDWLDFAKNAPALEHNQRVILEYTRNQRKRVMTFYADQNIILYAERGPFVDPRAVVPFQCGLSENRKLLIDYVCANNPNYTPQMAEDELMDANDSELQDLLLLASDQEWRKNSRPDRYHVSGGGYDPFAKMWKP